MKERFRAPVSLEELAKSVKGVIPTNTKNSTEWVLRNFRNWRENRNQLVPEKPVLENLFQIMDAEVLCMWLCCYVQQMQKESGENYPATTILAAFQRVLRMNKVPFNIFDNHGLRFSELRNTIDALSISLKKQGVGVNLSHAAVITIEHEKLMWESKFLSFKLPEALLRAMFVTVGLHFGL